MFGRATIRLGIGSHSSESLKCYSLVVTRAVDRYQVFSIFSNSITTILTPKI